MKRWLGQQWNIRIILLHHKGKIDILDVKIVMMLTVTGQSINSKLNVVCDFYPALLYIVNLNIDVYTVLHPPPPQDDVQNVRTYTLHTKT